MKNVIITGGPTNEYIDEIMKITNMSTGRFSTALAKEFLKIGYGVTLIINKVVNTEEIEKNENLKIIRIETTAEMEKALFNESRNANYEIVLHTAAVADYKPEYVFMLDDIADEIFEHMSEINSPQEIYDILCNPDCKISSDSKISSYQSDLTVKLGLTPKIIKNLRRWFKDAMIIGCKLLENVSKEELFDVAKKLVEKNDIDYVLANDLVDLRDGDITRYLVDKDGYNNIKLKTATSVVEFIHNKI